MVSQEIIDIVENFVLPESEPVKVVELKSGHINRTLRLDYQNNQGQESYLLQRVNDYVFKNVPAVMANIGCLLQNIDHPMKLVPCKNGANYYQDQKGGYWRIYNFLTAGMELQNPTHEELAAGAAAFGKFAADISKLAPSSFIETIPNFHHLPKRYQSFLESVKSGNQMRLAEISPYLSELADLVEIGRKIADALDSNAIPTRLAHNDTKLSNILFNREDHKPLAVVDLDTVMPGSPLYDYGDLVRSGAASRREDQYEGMALDLEKYKAINGGFIAPLKDLLTSQELDLLPMAPLAITVELSLRFFADYLTGDKYFAINYEKHNFDRGLAQLALARSMKELL